MRTEKRVQEKIVTDGVSKTGFTIYHRTGGSDVQKAVKTIKTILQTGFKPGIGAMYGKGLYGTTDRKSSFRRDNTSTYGIGLIKYLVPIRGILVFDYNLAGLLFGTGMGKSGYPAYSLCEQLVTNGIFSPYKIPRIFKVLSADLECTWGAGNRSLSADRAYRIFVEGIIEGKPIYSLAKTLSGIDQETVDLYINASASAKPYKNFDRFKGVNGIVFSGNHDGNVIVLYKFSHIKPLMWGVSDPGYPTDPKRWAVPMTPVGKNVSAADVASMLVDTASDMGVVSKKGSINSLFVQGAELANLQSIVKSLKSLAPWVADNLNGFGGISVAVPNKAGEPSVIYAGYWESGTFSGFFGGDNVCIKRAEALIGKPLPVQNYEANWQKGTFAGGYFGGLFNGGVFAGGQFEGVFNGGLWKWNKDAIWGKNAVFTTSSKTFIEYDGRIHDLDCDPVTWVTKKQAVSKTAGGAANYVDPTLSLKENLENSLPFKAEVVAPNTWGPAGSVEDKFKVVRTSFDWLWSKGIRFASKPKIVLSSTGIALVEGNLTFGRVAFDLYGEAVEINGGIIEGDNEFRGSMRAGIYNAGTFVGKWYGGTWNDYSCKWDKAATLIAGATIGTTSVIAQTTVVYNKKPYEIIPEAYLVWKSIPELVGAIKAGEYQDLIKKSKASGKSGAKTAQQIAKQYNKSNFTAQDLIAIIADDDDSDDSDAIAALNSSVEKSFAGSLNEFFDKRSLAKADRFFEKEYSYGELTDVEQDALYLEFKNTYEKVTGAAFDRSSFDWRADNWTFFGDAPDDRNPAAPVGGIAVRKQMSNDMYKLIASFGPFRSVMKGFIEFNQKHGNSAVWGIVTPEIKKILLRGNKDYVGLPGPVVKAMEPAIKKFTNGEVKSVGIDGTMKADTPAGIMTKVFVCNKVYVRWLIQQVEDPNSQSKLPVPQTVLKPLLGLIKGLLK